MSEKPNGNRVEQPLGNKIVMAALVSLLMVFGIREVGGIIYSVGEGGAGHDGELHLAYPIEFETSAGAEPVAEGPSFNELLRSASAEAGARKAAICSSCHSFEKGGANGAGPNLWGVLGREVASVSGFGYSGALEAFGGEWTYDRLDQYLYDSQGYIDGTAMNQKIRKDENRAQIIAYLRSLSDDPVPLPEETAAAETESEAG